MKYTNLVLLVAFIVFVAYLIASESRENPYWGKTVISFATTGNREQKEAYKKVIAAFEAKHPGVKVRLEWGGPGDFFGVILTRSAGGVPPDVFFMYEFKLPYFASKNALMDLTPFVERDFREDLKDFLPVAKEIFTYQDKLYAMPVSLAPVVLFYNRKIFDDAGLPYPNADWTWDDLRTAAIKITLRDQQGRIMQYGLNGIPHFEMLEMVTGKRRLTSNPLSANNDDPEIRSALNFFINLIVTDHVSPDLAAQREQNTVDMFAAGKAAMAIGGRWNTPGWNSISGFSYDAVPIPKWRNGHRSSYTHAVGYSVSSLSKNKELSWEFIKYLGGRECLAMLSRLGDTVPARLSVLESDAFLSPDIQPANDRAFIDALNGAEFIQVTYPPLPEYYKQSIESILAGQTTVEKAMRDVQSSLNRFIIDNNVKLLR